MKLQQLKDKFEKLLVKEEWKLIQVGQTKLNPKLAVEKDDQPNTTKYLELPKESETRGPKRHLKIEGK
jgi:hypothetical protein